MKCIILDCHYCCNEKISPYGRDDTIKNNQARFVFMM